MKIVVIGASGLIGKKTAERLQRAGFEVVSASRSTGVNAVTGEGLAGAMQGAEVVVDLSNSPSWEDKDVMEFFDKSTRNLLAAEIVAGVKHHIALSVVGTERLQESGYFRAKLVQEELIQSGKTPYTIVRATQFFEFLGGIAQFGTVGQTVHLSTAYMQPIAADDVADVMAAVCLEPPVNGTFEIGGPERVRISDIVGKYLNATNDEHKVVAEEDALYYGVKLNDQSLVPGENVRLCPTSFDEWFKLAALKK
ncbi:MAG: SDR family oxidoreductase [Terriglobales bacterium]